MKETIIDIFNFDSDANNFLAELSTAEEERIHYRVRPQASPYPGHENNRLRRRAVRFGDEPRWTSPTFTSGQNNQLASPPKPKRKETASKAAPTRNNSDIPAPAEKHRKTANPAREAPRLLSTCAMANGPPSEHRQYPYPNAYAESAKWLRQRTGDHAFTNHLLECKKSHEGDVDFRGRPPIPDDHHGVTVTYPRHAETLASLGLDPLPGEGEHAQRRPVAYRPPTPYQHKPTANDFGWSEEERMAPPEPQQPQPIIKKPRDAEAVNRHRFVSAPVRPSTGKVVLERRKPGTATSSSIGQPAREPRHVRFRLTPEVHTFDGASETQQINDMHDRAEESIAGHSGLSGWSPTLTSSSPTSRSAGIYAEPQVSMETKTALQHTAAGRASRGQLERTASSSKPHNTSRDVLTTAPREGHYHPWPAREGEPEVHRELFGGGSLAPFQNGKGLRQWAHDLFERNYKQRFTLKLDHELRVTRGQATHSYFEGVMVGDTRDGPGLDITDRGDVSVKV